MLANEGTPEQLLELSLLLFNRHASEIAAVKYFAAEAATVGPREAASYYMIFHRNRAVFSFGGQVLLTEALVAATTHQEDAVNAG